MSDTGASSPLREAGLKGLIDRIKGGVKIQIPAFAFDISGLGLMRRGAEKTGRGEIYMFKKIPY